MSATPGVESEGLCTVKYCPEPSSPDWHRCLVCGNNAVQHHHVDPRGMGGSRKRKYDKANVVPLCSEHHERITLHDWGNAFLTLPTENGTKRVYRIWDVHDNTILEREVPGLSAAAETTKQQDGEKAQALSAAALSEEEGDGDSNADSAVRGAGVLGTGGRVRTQGMAGLSEAAETEPLGQKRGQKRSEWDQGTEGRVDDFRLIPYHGAEFDPFMSLKRWLEINAELCTQARTQPWAIGDAINFGEAHYGEEASQADDWGVAPETASNYANVAKAIPLPRRRWSLPFSYHAEVYRLAPEEADSWLERAEAEGWTRSELREALGKSVSRVKRWSAQELREKAEAWALGDLKVREELSSFIHWLEYAGTESSA